MRLGRVSFGGRVVLGAVLCAALAAPAMAQMPPGPDFTCLCLKQSVDNANTGVLLPGKNSANVAWVTLVTAPPGPPQ